MAALMDWLLPPACASCGRSGSLLCRACLAAFGSPSRPEDRFVAPDAGIVIGDALLVGIAAFAHTGTAASSPGGLKYGALRASRQSSRAPPRPRWSASRGQRTSDAGACAGPSRAPARSRLQPGRPPRHSALARSDVPRLVDARASSAHHQAASARIERSAWPISGVPSGRRRRLRRSSLWTTSSRRPPPSKHARPCSARQEPVRCSASRSLGRSSRPVADRSPLYPVAHLHTALRHLARARLQAIALLEPARDPSMTSTKVLGGYPPSSVQVQGDLQGRGGTMAEKHIHAGLRSTWSSDMFDV